MSAAAWTPEHARAAHEAAREDLAQRVASQIALGIALRRVRAAFMADNGWTQSEIAQTLSTPMRTVRRDVHYMRQLPIDADQCSPPIRARDRVHPPVGRGRGRAPPVRVRSNA